jgi:hypothetical protein
MNKLMHGRGEEKCNDLVDVEAYSTKNFFMKYQHKLTEGSSKK